MAFVLSPKQEWGKFGLQLAIWSTVLTAACSLVHGMAYGLTYSSPNRPVWLMLETWFADFHYIFEQLLYVGALVFVAAKFFETHTIFSVGFDKMDAAKISMKGPDEDNIVWIGHRYGNRLEAETVAATIENRLKESA